MTNQAQPQRADNGVNVEALLSACEDPDGPRRISLLGVNPGGGFVASQFDHRSTPQDRASPLGQRVRLRENCNPIQRREAAAQNR